MNIIFFIISVVIIITPIYLIGNYFYKKDTIKEPKKLLIKLFLSGICSTVITIVVSIFGNILFPEFSSV